MTDLDVRPVDRVAHARAVRSTAAAVAARLQQVLGRDVVALITAKQTRTVTRWVTGTAVPSAQDQQLLRDTLQVVELLAEVEGDDVTRAWFIGMNPQLDDESPAEEIAAGHVRDVLAAARTFINAG
ncbi:hypothetical protein SCB71_21240 (plasmid) [Herbiconiux sp. KACC 21604]|uniref:hypothetical protein n=1 Tax=unclassified Herbiconiux TaxID=2618217 RepID=UPI00149189EC|nr:MULTISPECIES: hypothetical protein [unclassified Herbiconiux]QJU56270.1 hypothetical protein HL652_21035 [Herbiconiux sp. SALV-R1]WPO88775.1 hypothetical protein SCB71_21240 [Herbiconiux sp. KACC 21604]